MTPTGQRPLPPPIETPDQALRWAEEIVGDCEDARRRCDVPLDKAAKTTVRELRRRETQYLIHHGSALGIVSALMRVGLLESVAYNALVLRVQRTLIGSSTDLVGG